MRVMVIVKASEDSEAGVMPSTELLTEMGKFNEELVKAGVMLAGEGLHPSSKGVRVRFAADRSSSVIDGPFAETKELIAGYWLLQVRDMEEAVEWISRAPFEDGDVEIRPVFESEDFGDELTPELREQEDRLRAEVEKQSDVAARARWGVRAGIRRDARHGRQPDHRGRLEDRVGPADRRPRSHDGGRRPRRGPRPGGAGRRARELAAGRGPAQARRVADDHRQEPRDRRDAPRPAAGAQAGGDRPRPRAAERQPARPTPPSTRSGTTSSA